MKSFLILVLLSFQVSGSEEELSKESNYLVICKTDMLYFVIYATLSITNSSLKFNFKTVPYFYISILNIESLFRVNPPVHANFCRVLFDYLSAETYFQFTSLNVCVFLSLRDPQNSREAIDKYLGV